MQQSFRERNEVMELINNVLSSLGLLKEWRLVSQDGTFVGYSIKKLKEGESYYAGNKRYVVMGRLQGPRTIVLHDSDVLPDPYPEDPGGVPD